MPVLPLQPVSDHFERTLAQQRRSRSAERRARAASAGHLRRSQFGRVNPGNADLAVAKLERVAIDHAGGATAADRMA